MSEEEREEIDVDAETTGALPPFAALIAALSDVNVDGEFPEEASAQLVEVDRISISLAIELAVEPTAGKPLRVRGSTPTQWTETTVMPVFHRLTMHIDKHSDAQE